jgi:sirohydrochlorin ferrochelatase
MRDILLIDNGSKRAEATLSLRGIAERLAEAIGEPVHAVSLLHADKVPASALGGRPADIFESFLRDRLGAGQRDFLIIPLFFGPSRAISELVPQMVETLRQTFGDFEVQVTRPLCPLPQGEPELTAILLEHIDQAASAQGIEPRSVLLVDHGSPVPAVTAVRRWLRDRLTERLDPDIQIGEAVMERRPGAEYDFNGDLLEERLLELATEDPTTPVILAMLFLSPGRHAGPGGDIAEICESVQQRHAGFRAYPSPLVGSHPGLIRVLAKRVAEVGQASREAV